MTSVPHARASEEFVEPVRRTWRWLDGLRGTYPDEDRESFAAAAAYARERCTDAKGPDGEALIERALGAATILASVRLDADSLRAAILLALPAAHAFDAEDVAKKFGADVAAHCAPAALRDGELRISAESTAWATQLRLLAGTLLARIVAELGPEVVTKVVVTGPVAPSWKHGPRSVHGARGPRDTYG